MGRLLTFAILLVSLSLGACATKLQQLRTANPKGNDFHLALASHYLAFAEKEADLFDWWDSRYFANKGLLALRGTTVKPETLERWNVPASNKPVLMQARKNLLELVEDYSVRDVYYKEAAYVQFLFDCWLEQQEEVAQGQDAFSCREGFYNALDQLYLATTSDSIPILKAEEAPKPVKSTIVYDVTAPKIKPQFVYFDFNSTTLNSNGQEIINILIATLKDAESYDITLNGYADRSGRPEYNLKLSKKRAQSIKKALVKGGLKESAITIFAFGETSGKVTTKDGLPEKANRMVEIVVDR